MRPQQNRESSLLEDLQKLRKLELQADDTAEKEGYYFDLPTKLKSLFSSDQKIQGLSGQKSKEPESEGVVSRSSHQSSESLERKSILKNSSKTSSQR